MNATTFRPKLAALVIAVSVLIASGATFSLADDEATHFGKEAPTKEQWIDALRVKKPLTRSLAGSRSVQVEPVERAASLEVYFAFDSSELSTEARAQLDGLAAALSDDELGNASFLVEGHTDAAGSEAYNLNLSQRRAKAVRDYLLGQNELEPKRLEAVGRGETDLLVEDDPMAAQNRRVQVVSRAME